MSDFTDKKRGLIGASDYPSRTNSLSLNARQREKLGGLSQTQLFNGETYIKRFGMYEQVFNKTSEKKILASFDLIFKFIFNGQEAELGGEVIKIYYHPKNPLIEPCSDARCASAGDGETCMEIYCLSKTGRENVIDSGSYRYSEWDEPIQIRFPEGWTESNIRGIPMTLLLLDSIDPKYPIRIVLSDKRKQNPEVYNYYYNLLQDMSIEHDAVVFDYSYMDMMFIYTYSQAMIADYEEPIPVDNINEELGFGYVPMYEAYNYTEDEYDSPENYDYGIVTLDSGCGGTPEGWWAGTYTAEQFKDYKTINPLNPTRVIELTVYEGSIYDLLENALPSGMSFTLEDGTIVNPLLATIPVTCPDCIYRVKTIVTTTLEEKTVKSYYTGITTTPGSETEVSYIARVGTHDYGEKVDKQTCHAIIEPGHDAEGSIDKYSETLQTMEYQGPLYPNITECPGGGTIAFGYSWTSVLTSISTYRTSTPTTTEYSIGGRETQEQVAAPIQIPVIF